MRNTKCEEAKEKKEKTTSAHRKRSTKDEINEETNKLSTQKMKCNAMRCDAMKCTAKTHYLRLSTAQCTLHIYVVFSVHVTRIHILLTNVLFLAHES